MAEETLAPVPGENRRLIYIAVAVVVVFTFVFLFFIRSCGSGGGGSGYAVIYSNLELKDAGNVVARLKELKIPYKIGDRGTSISVPKNKADQARLGLAEKNLPLGGEVGWEIFDEAKLGATDFDRRIQLIRAISGELSRTIKRISAIENCRVQIVMPETRLFEVEKAPVTASVLIKTVPGEQLLPSQVNGIIHLVASSVENLKPQNVTIVDNHGNILMAKPVRPYKNPQFTKEAVKEVLEVKKENNASEQQKKAEELAVKEAKLKKRETELKQLTKKISREAAARQLSAEEKSLLKLQAKEEYEEQLTQKAQSILNQFYPPNSVIVKVNVELAGSKAKKLNAVKVKKPQLKDGLEISRLHTVILVDNRLDLSRSLKKTTYATIASAIGYERFRGDRIIIQKVPFHYALTKNTLPAGITANVNEQEEKADRVGIWLGVYDFVAAKLGFRNFVAGFIILLVLSALVLALRRFFGGRREREFEFGPPEFLEEEEELPKEAATPEALNTINALKNIVNDNPERLANLLKNWLSEEVPSK